MKKTVIISLCIFTSCVFAQKPIEIPLWADGAPNDNGITGTEEKLENGRISNINIPTLTLYFPSKSNGMAIIMCPGGGYARLAMNHEGHDMASWFNAQGITYAVLKYRMPNGHSNVPLSDAEQAMRIMREHAKEWKLDTNKIGIMGASAGGHLASTLATHYSSEATKPDFQILLYPVITMVEDSSHAGSRKNLLGEAPAGSEEEKKYSNECHVTAKTPQGFIALSADDKTVPPMNGIGYASALMQQGVPVSLHVYPIGGHGWGFRDRFLYKRQWTGELEKWLSELYK